MLNRIKKFRAFRPIFFIFMLAGCAAPLKIGYNPSLPAPVRTEVRKSVLVEQFKDGRDLSKSPFNDPRTIGRITATVFDLRSDRLTLSEDPAAYTTAAFTRELRDAGFEVLTPGEAGSADYILTGELKDFRLDIVDRDRISIEAELRLADAGTGQAVWSGSASVNESRFAGVMGNTRGSIAEFLEASLSRALRGAVAGLVAAIGKAPSGPAGPQNAASGRLLITSEPPGAKVYIKDVYQGLTPVTVGLEPGVYEVIIRKKGFREVKEAVSVRAGETTELPEDLEKE